MPVTVYQLTNQTYTQIAGNSSSTASINVTIQNDGAGVIGLTTGVSLPSINADFIRWDGTNCFTISPSTNVYAKSITYQPTTAKVLT